ncbi:probable arginine--tRNA ligase, mitochondrial isoform X2 [Brienomyrus brachyistius]|uniref:probable arginine--tRNA ligase, mitochondrial isoform X2 n=1 Tax=Brienomyrus brachyistius TaxID=42636 RepID=UPI0020B20CF9|nr:probable arginine--tRNA ligase, mitochondrial isoform X2 [Brienomyrus brachyistius]
MACFFRKNIASKIAKIFGQSEECFISAVSTIPVSKKQQSDFRLSVSHLRQKGFLPSAEDIQTQAESLARQLNRDSVVEDVTVGRAVINFKIKRDVLAEKILEQVSKEGHTFGLKSALLCGQQKGRTLVEFSSPNIAKKFHAGHLRSTIIGNFISNLKEALGNEVVRMNYLGDWGLQFGMLGAGFQDYGSQEELKANPLQHLFQVYVRVNAEAEKDEGVRQRAGEFFRQLESGEEEALALWRHFREISVGEYQRVYQRLGIRFHEYSGESFHQKQALDVLERLRAQGLLRTTEKGTGVVDLSPAGDMSCFATVLRSDGTSLYITRDLAAAIDRKEAYDFDEMIYVTDKSQEGHFRQVFQILRAMGHQWADSCRHVPFGLVRGMKTRKGEVVFLEDVLEEAKGRVLRNMQATWTSKELEDPDVTAERVGVAALIIQDFRGPLESDYSFDWGRVLQMQGDTGLFLQYTHSRLCSLTRMHGSGEGGPLDPMLLQEEQGAGVLKQILRYDEALLQCSCDLQPKHLVNFLLALSHLVAVGLRTLPVKGSPLPLAQARLRLFDSARTVLANGMRILGVTPVEKM